MSLITQGTLYSRKFLLVLSSDHVTGATGLSPTVLISKGVSPFAAPAGTVVEVGSGWYALNYTVADTNTVGDLAGHATAPGCDPTDWDDQVITGSPGGGGTVVPPGSAGATFLSDAQLLNDLADTLQKAQGTLSAYWVNVCTQSHRWAFGILAQFWLGKGFTLAQLQSWDYGIDYERNLTLWRALTRPGSLQAVDDKLVATLDVRKDLCEQQVLLAAGVPQIPAGDAGQVGTGPMMHGPHDLWSGARFEPGPRGGFGELEGGPFD